MGYGLLTGMESEPPLTHFPQPCSALCRHSLPRCACLQKIEGEQLTQLLSVECRARCPCLGSSTAHGPASVCSLTVTG
ncbi:unnamed protein product [Lota lota]